MKSHQIKNGGRCFVAGQMEQMYQNGKRDVISKHMPHIRKCTQCSAKMEELNRKHSKSSIWAKTLAIGLSTLTLFFLFR